MGKNVECRIMNIQCRINKTQVGDPRDETKQKIRSGRATDKL